WIWPGSFWPYQRRGLFRHGRADLCGAGSVQHPVASPLQRRSAGMGLAIAHVWPSPAIAPDRSISASPAIVTRRGPRRYRTAEPAGDPGNRAGICDFAIFRDHMDGRLEELRLDSKAGNALKR